MMNSEKGPQIFKPEKISGKQGGIKKLVGKRKISEKHERMLSILDNLHSSFANQKIENYVVGGWAISGHKGKIERAHRDIDFLTWEKDLERLKEILQKGNFEVIEGEYDKKGEFHKFTYKLMARKENIDLDFVFIKLDEENKEVFSPVYPKFRFPLAFLDGGEITLRIRSGQTSKFNVVSKELLLATKINSERKKDQRDVGFLKKQIGDKQKIKEIKDKYGLDYKQFKKEL